LSQLKDFQDFALQKGRLHKRSLTNQSKPIQRRYSTICFWVCLNFADSLWLQSS